MIEKSDPAKLIQDVVQKVDAGAHFIIVDATPETLLKMADAIKGKEAMLINYSAPDDSLREENCRAQVAAHGADPLDAHRRARPVSRLEEVAALVPGARPDREGQALRRGAAPLRQALRRQDRRGTHVHL